ncbi:MAG: multiple sugar transport system substrate-binding protein [Thermomicrobiales bacterium]|nr:multiple sugar transport system substrate-binding protein [Thermomicrobiales bacterium]
MASFQSTARIGRRALIGAASALAAFGGRAKTEARTTRTVRFAFFGTDSEQQAYRRLIAAFHEIHSDITVEQIGMGSGDPSIAMGRATGSPYQPWLETAFVGNMPPDVFILAYQRFRSFAARGIVEPLGPYLRSSKILRADDFYPAALDAFRYEGFADDGLGGIPQNASSLAVYYNLDVFEEFGVSVPEDGWDWSTFASAAARLTVDRDGDGRIGVYGLVLDPTISRYAAFVWGAGGDFVDDPNRPSRLVLDTKEAQAGLSWLASLGPAGMKVTPPEVESRRITDLVRFCSGHAAMMIHSRRVVPALREVPGLRWNAAPLPIGAVPANVLHSDAFCMAAGAKDKEAAWTFIEFAVGPVGQSILAETGRTVPSLRSVAESDSFMKGTSFAGALGLQQAAIAPANNQTFVDNIAIARRLPTITTLPAVEASFNQAFKQAFYVDANVTTAVTNFFNASHGVLGDHLSVPRYVMMESESAMEE